MNLSSMNKDETLNLPQDDGYIAFQRTITEALKSNADFDPFDRSVTQKRNSIFPLFGINEEEPKALVKIPDQIDMISERKSSQSLDLSVMDNNSVKKSSKGLRLENFTIERRESVRSVTLDVNYKNRLRSLKEYRYCLILPDDPWKLKWDFFISILIIWTCVATPLSLAFTNNDQNVGWIVIDSLTDFCFLIDIIFTFRSAYFNSTEKLEDNLKKISCHYIRFWFWIDFVAILPIGLILNRTSNPNALIRIARITRLYRLVKMVKLLRMMRLMKNRQKYTRFLRSILRISIGVERLFLFSILFFLLCHAFSCFWYFLAQNGSADNLYQNSWVVRYGYADQPMSEIYLAGMYFTITTMTTVGYGDISAGNNRSEQIYVIFLMMFGVVVYSFIIGSITGIFQSLDSKTSKIRQRVDVLNSIRSEYNIDFGLYWRLRRSLHLEQLDAVDEKQKFLNELPTSLKVELSNAIYNQVVRGILFFKERSKHFIAAVAPKLRRIQVGKNECFFRTGDPLDGVYFLKEGQVSYIVKEREDDIFFAAKGPGTYFGEVDFLRPGNNGELQARRTFTIKAKEVCVALFLPKSALFNIGPEYKQALSELFMFADEEREQLLDMQRQAIKWFYKKNPGLNTGKKFDTYNSGVSDELPLLKPLTSEDHNEHKHLTTGMKAMDALLMEGDAKLAGAGSTESLPAVRVQKLESSLDLILKELASIRKDLDEIKKDKNPLRNSFMVESGEVAESEEAEPQAADIP